MKYKNFEELPIWQSAREIVARLYGIISMDERVQNDFRLKDQLIGAAISIMNNIAEGFDAGNNKEFIRFLRYSQRSCSEIMSMTYILSDVYSLNAESRSMYDMTLNERKQIKAFIKYLGNSGND